MVHINRRKDRFVERKRTFKDVISMLDKAEEMFPKDKEEANACVRKARRMAMKVRLRLPPELKRKFCKHCYSFLKPGINARIRIHKGRVIVLCKECKRFTRIPLAHNPRKDSSQKY